MLTSRESCYGQSTFRELLLIIIINTKDEGEVPSHTVDKRNPGLL